MSDELPNDAPQPRLCHLVKWPDFDGYGFNLHAEKAKSGQFIGKVDDDSPAYHAELKEGDRIIEVNGVNIANENHRQVVERIKAVPNETKLLVLDNDADKWFKERKVVVKNSLPNVKYIKTPVPRPTENNKSKQNDKVVVENVSANTNGTSSPNHSETQSLENSSGSSTPKTVPKQDSPSSSSPASSVRPSESPESAHKAQNGNSALNNGNNNNNSSSNGGLAVPNGVSAVVSTPPPASRMAHSKAESKPEDAKGTATTNGNSKAPLGTPNGAKAPPAHRKADTSGELNLDMSAAQMREMLANKKKNDPKKQTMDMREKYQIVQQM